MSSINYVPQVGMGANASGQTVYKRKRKRDRSANIPADELRLLRQSGETNRDRAIEMAHDDLLRLHRDRFNSVAEVIACLSRSRCSKRLVNEFVQLRDLHMTE